MPCMWCSSLKQSSSWASVSRSVTLESRAQHRPEVALAGPDPLGRLLDDQVRLVADHARLHQRQQHALREDQAARHVQVRQHPLWEDVEAVHDPGEHLEHVVQRDRRVRQEALGFHLASK